MSEAAPGVALSELGIGQGGKITALDLPPEAKQRLLEMGMTVGARIEVVRFAPLGDPVDIKVRGYHLSIRKHEAAGILVEMTNDQ
jgi:Fe2+ transport system protein FeoA